MSSKPLYPVTVPTGRAAAPAKYSHEFRLYVYQLWLYVADRNVAQTVRILADPSLIPSSVDIEPQEPVTNIKTDTISFWIKSDDWTTRGNDELRAISPAIWDTTAQNILMGAKEAITYLRGVANGSEALDRNSRTRVFASQLLIDRAGFQPWARSTRSEPIEGPKDDFTESFAGMETHELARSIFEAATGLPAGNIPDSDPNGV